MKFLLCSLLLAANLWGDARYKLAYKVKANLLVQLAARLAGMSKLSSEGEEVLLKGGRILVRGEKSNVMVDYGTGWMMVVDHTDNTYERLRIEDMKKRIAADFPPALVDGLKSIFSGNGSSAAPVVRSEREGEAARMPSLERFRKLHGLAYLAPAMESIVALVPSVDRSLKALRAEGRLALALRVQIGALLDASVEIRDYRETSVNDREFDPPTGYQEVKVDDKE